MNGKRYLADTNALLQKRPALQSLIKSEWSYSFITEIELLGKPRIKEDELKKLQQLLSTAFKIIHTDAVNEKAIFLKQQYSIKTPDAIIAATAWE